MKTYLTLSFLALSLLSGCSTGRNGVTINIQEADRGTATGGGESSESSRSPTMTGGIIINTYQGVNRASVGQGNAVEAQSDVKPSTTADVSATGL